MFLNFTALILPLYIALGIPHTVFAGCIFRQNGDVELVRGWGQSLIKFPELQTFIMEKVDEATETYLDIRKDSSFYKTKFLIDAMGITVLFTIELDNDAVSGEKIRLISVVGDGSDVALMGLHMPGPRKSFTFSAISSLEDMKEKFLNFGWSCEHALERGERFINEGSSVLKKYGYVKDSTPMGYRARLVKGTDWRNEEVPVTDFYVFFAAFFSTE